MNYFNQLHQYGIKNIIRMFKRSLNHQFNFMDSIIKSRNDFVSNIKIIVLFDVSEKLTKDLSKYECQIYAKAMKSFKGCLFTAKIENIVVRGATLRSILYFQFKS